MLNVLPKKTLSMQTRDGVRLDADIYYPEGSGPFPVLLMRQPYGRAIASTVVYAHPTWYAAQGYIVVIQDVRGRGSSEGEFSLFASEIADGYDTVEWVAQLPKSSGQVGMYGFSYQGMTQLYAAISGPPALKTICPSMAAYDLYADWAYEGGAFSYQLNLSWAAQIAAETARRHGDPDAYRALYIAARSPNTHDVVCPRSEILERLAPNSFYHEWLRNSDSSAEYWQKLSPKTYFESVDLPMLHIGGWFDSYLRGTMQLYRAMASRSPFPQHLWVGPWAHLPWGRRTGALDYGEAANSPIDRLQVRWFDQFLKGKDTGLLNEAPVCLFEMGTNQWRKFDQFPAAQTQTVFLSSRGLACMGDQEGKLSPEATPDPAVDACVHDPWRPVPASGGHASAPAGPFDRAALDSRTDVLTYTTAPLTEDLTIAGDLIVELYCIADTPSFDLCAVLSEVKPNGQVFNFAQGYLRVNPPEAPPGLLPPHLLAIALQPTCIRIPAGHALRLSLSAACSPAYPVNPGTGASPYDSRLLHAQVITVSVFSGGEFGSRLKLSVVSDRLNLDVPTLNV
jgi:putative CocE/NonD family hydrolase